MLIKPSFSLGSFSFSARWILVAVTAAGFLLRIVRLEFQPLWWDEGYSLFVATRDVRQILERTAVDIHPPLYYLLLHVWMGLVDKGDIAARLFSVAIGVVTIPVLYVVVKHMFGVRVAVIGALLMAIAPLHIYYSQEVRMYGLVTLLGLASVYAFVVLLTPAADSTEPGRRRSLFWTLYVASSAAALYTQYFAAFILAFQAVVVIGLCLGRGSTSRFVSRTFGWIAAWVAIGVLYLPWILYAGPKLYAYINMKVAHEAYVPLDPLTYAALHLIAFSVGHASEFTGIIVAGALLILLAIAGAVVVLRVNRETALHAESRWIVTAYLVVPLLLGYVVNLVYPFHPTHTERLLLLAAPAYYALVAVGIDAVWARVQPAGWVALLLVAAISAAALAEFYTLPRYPEDDYRPLIKAMQKQAQPGDAFLAVYPWQIGYLEAYYRGVPLTIVETPNDDWIGSPARLRQGLDALLVEHPRVWLPALQTLGRLLEDSVDAYLRPHAYTVLDSWFGTTRLELFAMTPDPVSPNREVTLNDGVMLAAYAISTTPIAAGRDTLAVRLSWADPLPTNLNVSLRLIDAEGNTWAQDDRGAEGGEQRIGFFVPLGTPPGHYDLKLVAYATHGSQKLGTATLGPVEIKAPDTPNLSAIPHRMTQTGGDGLQLVGYDAGDRPLRPGDTATVELYWQTDRTLILDGAVTIQCADGRGNVFGQNTSAVTRGIYPMTLWPAGQIVRDPQTVTLRGDTPDGALNLVVTVADANGQPVFRQQLDGVLQIRGRPHYFGAPAPKHTLDYRFGDVARLVGMDAERETDYLHLVLYWQAAAPTVKSYQVFVHLLDENGTIVSQQDHVPGDGAYPTTSWVKGEYLVDEYVLPLSTRQAARVAIGLYDLADQIRLPAYAGSEPSVGDHVSVPMPAN